MRVCAGEEYRLIQDIIKSTMEVMKKLFLHISRLPSSPVLIVLVMGFTISASLGVLSIRWSSGDRESLAEKGQRLAALIISTNLENMMDLNRAAMRSTAESFMEDMDIESIIIRDGSGAVLVNTAKQSYRTTSIKVKKPFSVEGMKIGTLEITVSNASKWKNTERVAELIASSSIDHIWDYNISSLKAGVSSFFKDQDIKAIRISEESGIELVRLEREAGGTEELKIHKKLFRGDRFIGTLEVVFCDCSAVLQEHSRKNHLIIYMVLAIVFGAASLILVVRNNRRKTREEDLLQHDAAVRQPLTWSISGSTEEKMEKAMAYIGENYTSAISREGLAAMLNLNPDNMGRYFKMYTGERINDYINRLRVEKAASLLIETPDNIVHIAFAVGFENLSTFNRAFQKIREETPTEFRKKHHS